MGRLSRWWRGRKRAKELAHKNGDYARRFKALGRRAPVESEIRARTIARCGVPANLSSRPHTLAIYHDHNWEGACLGPALADLGTVSVLDRFHPSDRGLSARQAREVRHRRIVEAVARIQAAHPIDAVFTYLSGEQVGPRTIEQLRSLRRPLVNLSLNDKESFVGHERDGVACGMRDIAPYFDLCWTSTSDAVPKYLVEGAMPLFLPEGGNPRVHRPLGIARDIDVAFVGQRYGERSAVVERLARAGIRIRTFGAGWDAGPISTEEMVRVWNRSRIVLGFSGVLNHRDTYCLKGRDFEVPMSGACYLTEHHAELATQYEIGREIMTYRSVENMEAIIRALLANPVRAEAIGHAGLARAVRQHTWQGRFRRVLRALGVTRDEEHRSDTDYLTGG